MATFLDSFGQLAARGPHTRSIRPAHNLYLIKKIYIYIELQKTWLRKKKSRVSVYTIQRQTDVSSLLRNDISHEIFPLKSPLQLGYYNCPEVNIMLVGFEFIELLHLMLGNCFSVL